MDERVRETLDTYERNATAYTARHDDRSVVAAVVEQFCEATDARRSADSEPPRVLDVGCGPGWESATFAERGYEVVSIDLTPAFLERTRERAPTAAVLRGDMRSLPFAADSFDGLWACASLLHVPRAEIQPTLEAFERVLADGGVATLSLQRPGARDGADGAAEYERDERYFERYEPATVRRLCSEAGFAVRRVEMTPIWVAVTASATAE